ncbi:rhomboid family intramembrane serine protease [Pseudonocardia ailaonensis]|uniref:Rhomboid family intramembrane serine protease n=1 Tax=Pseudonocardia ailaonensis TaxID=367279 RepID=A0ABN2NKJ7_9PSEU
MTGPAGPVGLPACARHPDRPTGLSCTRCGRPACVECLRDASVGQQCVDCVREGSRGSRRATTVAGAPPGGKPLVVPVLMALNIALFVFTAAQARSIGSNDRAALFREWVLVPGRVDTDWWTPLTSGFLHYGPLHLAFNMFALWIIGRDLELVLGRGRFLAVYLVALLGGSASVLVFTAPNTATAGASGAVFGLMGGYFVVARRLRVPTQQVVTLIAINLAIGFIPGSSLSVAGHLGGLVVGGLATAAIVHAPNVRNRTLMQVGAIAVLTIVVLSVIVGRAAVVA